MLTNNITAILKMITISDQFLEHNLSYVNLTPAGGLYFWSKSLSLITFAPSVLKQILNNKKKTENITENNNTPLTHILMTIIISRIGNNTKSERLFVVQLSTKVKLKFNPLFCFRPKTCFIAVPTL